MKKLFLLFITIAIFSSCMTEEIEAKRVLEEQGYSSITFTGYKCFACSEDDFYATGFTAISIAGKQVKGTVCGGLNKGYTIRLN